MDKGIRGYVNNKFLELLPTRINTRAGNCAFRKTVMCDAMEQFTITLASASTHYNHSFIEAQKAVAAGTMEAKLLEGLGRAPDKKGGRKPKAKAVVEEVVAPVLLLGYTPAAVEAPTLPDYHATVAALELQGEQAAEAATAHQAVVVEEVAAEVTKLFSVLTKKGDKLIASDITKDEAEAMVAKAARAKKAALYIA